MAQTPRSPFAQVLSIRLPRVNARWVMLTVLGAVGILGAGTWAQRAGLAEGPPNFDVRSAKDPATAGYLTRFAAPPALAEHSSQRATAMADLGRAVRGALVDIHPETGTPEIVGARPGAGFLTGASADRVGTMRAFLSTYADVYGLTPDQVANLVLVADYMNPAGNMGWVEFEQRLNGLPVFQGLIRGGFTAQGELVRTTGPLAAGMDASLLPVSPVLGAAEAVSRAAETVKWTVPAGSLMSKGTDSLGRTIFARGAMADDAKAWLLYFPLSPGIARLAWATEIWGDPDAFLTLVDAEDGTLLFRKNMTNYQTQSVTYHVYNDDSPAPMSPSTTLPGMGLQAPLIARTAIALIGNEGMKSFNNLGWITDGNNTTDGNNVEAGLDRDGINGVDTPIAGSGFRVFDFAYNPSPGSPPPGEDPLTPAFQAGEVTHGFYWTNEYHDRLYLLGFTELARNFQNDNFGRGGVALDRVSGEFQDCPAAPCPVNNANFATPSDGGRGRMQMYVFSGPTPDRTSGLDVDVLLHELTHGTSNRLHNNAAGLGTTMSRGMGEGWSDFYARSVLSSAGEDPDAIYTTGGWVTNLMTGGYVDNYYYGIRRFPYAVRSNIGANGRPHNPLTFADIDGTQINLTDGAFPPGPLGSATACQVHNIGEVWASTLFEVRALYIKRLGYATGHQRFLQFVTDGMKLDPVNPTLIQGRDAILAAAVAGGGTSADMDDIWTGFATRGIGYSAQVVNAGSCSVVEAFDIPGIAANGSSVVAESIPNGRLDSGETVTVSLCITNTAASTSGSVTGALQATGGVLSPSGAQVYGTVAPAGNVCRNYSLIVGPACGSTLTATLQAQETGGLTRMLNYAFPVGSQVPTFAENFDGVVAPALPAGWTTTTLLGTVNPWTTNLTTPDTAPNRAFAANPSTVSDNVLVSTAIAVPAGASVLSFRNHYNTEAGFDGGVLEISISGGAYADILAAGGSFTSGGYTGPLGAAGGNPIGGRQAWNGNSGGYITTTVAMPPAAAGQNVTLRWRMGTDSIIGATGWAVDSISFFIYQCSSQLPVITTQPLSQTVMSGTSATLTVVAAGTAPLGYQWYQGASGDTSTPIGGATSAAYTTPALVAPANYWVRVSNIAGTADSTTAALTIGPAAGVNLLQNGDFSAGNANWNVFEEPNIQWNVTAGVFQFWRQNPGTGSTQATVFQVTNQAIASPLRAQFDLGNSSTARKRVSVLIIDSDFSDITVCTFWLAPLSPLATYTMRTHTTKPWNNAAIYFYAATKGQDGGFYQLDNVSLQYDPTVASNRTDCVDPTVPAPPGGAPSGNLLPNGHFASGALSPWLQFGSMTSQIAGGIFEFIRPAPLPTPAGVIYQNTGQVMAANQIMTATFQLGNSSSVRKRVTVLLQESDFSDLTACTFWLAPNSPLRDFTMRGFATKAWTNATLAIYAASVGPQTWTRVDNVTFDRTPATAIVGTECVEPALAPLNSWASAMAYPIPILDQAVVTVGGNLYAFSGVSNNVIVANAYRFDGATWTAIAPLPAAVEFPAAVTDGTDIYILGGVSTAGVPQTTLYRYNVGANTYTALAPFTTGTWNHAAVYLNGRIYKFGGTGPATASTNAHEIYDVVGNSWSAGATYPLAASFISAFAHGNYIHAAGGIQSVGGVNLLKTYRYDPVGNVWNDAAMADLPATRWGAATAFYNGSAVLAGGFVGGVISASAVAWDPVGNSWVALSNMPADRGRMTGATLGGSVHVIGGRSNALPGFTGTADNQKLTYGIGAFADDGGSSPTEPPAAAPIDPGASDSLPQSLARGSSLMTLNNSAPDWSGTSAFQLDRDTARGAIADRRWQAVASVNGLEVLYWTKPVDLTDAASAQLSFVSSLSGRSTAEVQASVDGITWQRVAVVPGGTNGVTADLTAFAGQVVYVRFVFKTAAPAGGAAPDRWTIDDVVVDIRAHTARAGHRPAARNAR